MLAIGTIVKINPSYSIWCDQDKYFMVTGFPLGSVVTLRYIANDMSASDPSRQYYTHLVREIPYGKTQPIYERPFGIADNHMGIFNLCFATLKCGLDSLYVYDHSTGTIQKNADKLNLFADKSYFILNESEYLSRAIRYDCAFHLYNNIGDMVSDMLYENVSRTEYERLRIQILGFSGNDYNDVTSLCKQVDHPTQFTLEELETMKIYKSMAQ